MKTTITWNAEWEEFIVKRGKSTYHTNDYQDAVATATNGPEFGGEIIDRTPKSKRK